MTDEAREALIASADGDGRFLLNQVETLFAIEIEQPLGPAELSDLLHRRVPVYDKDREGHYNLISALHKTIRGSDPQAALYYLARMLVAGEEPLYLLRRLTRAAVEDIGMADPNALVQCLAAKDSYDFLGSPEGELAIVQACLYLATAPKSNATYAAQKAAWRSARETGSLMPPMHILNAPTKLMKNVGYGKGYAYDHDAGRLSGQDYWPEEMDAQKFYEPTDRGFEAKVRERMEFWESGAKSCNKARRRRLIADAKQGAAHMYQVDQGAYWQAQTMLLGPENPHRNLDPDRDVDRRSSGQMGAPEGDRPHARAQEHMTGTPEETVGHQLGTIAKLIIWLVGIMAALTILESGKFSPRSTNYVTLIFAFLPRLIGFGLILVRRLRRRADRPAPGRDCADRAPTSTGCWAGSGIGKSAPQAHRPRLQPATTPGTAPRQHRSSRRCTRVRHDHHPDRDRRPSGSRNRSDFGPRDCDAQPDLCRASAHPRRGAVDRYRLRHRSLPEDDHRIHPSPTGFDDAVRSPACCLRVLLHRGRRQRRDDRDHPRRVDRGSEAARR